MKTSNTLVVLTCLIAVLSLVAAGTGVLYQGEGASFEFRTLRGETSVIYGHGLYRWEPVLLAAQAISQDVVTLTICIPLLLVALVLYRRGRLRGQLLLAGTLAYFLYTYTTLAFGASYNPLFLVYVALFSLSLFAFVLATVAVDVRALPAHFTQRLPRRAIAVFMFAAAAFLLLAWLGRIVPALLTGGVPYGLESNTTLYIQVMDLGLVVPLLIVAGAMLWKREPIGYLLASIGLVKFTTMGMALVAMIIGQALSGIAMAGGEVVMFPTLALVALTMTFLLLRDLHESPVRAPEVS